METISTPIVRFSGQLMAEDCARKGWSKVDLANAAGVSDMTVIRFFRGQGQTAKTAKALAAALGHDVDRYLIPSREEVAS